MKTRVTAVLILAVVVAFYFAARGSMQTQPETKAVQADVPKFALLVGINRYKKFKDYNQNIRDLRGTQNDVRLMKGLLAEYSFKEDSAGAASDKYPCGQQTPTSSVKTLCSEQATRDAILQGFRQQLIENAKNYFTQNKLTAGERDKGVTVVFYYSGHGSKLEDKNGDESDGIDETIVAQDSDRNGVKDIIDDEFDALYKELSQYTTNITMMFDSCHSGSVTRGEPHTKSVERTIKTKNNSRGGENSKSNDGINILGNADYVTISGSLPTQESQEDVFVDTQTKKEQWDGALTYNFVNLLRQNPGLTYREIINLMRPAVAKFNQTPQVEGDIDRQIFGGSSTRGEVSLAIVGEPQKVQRTYDSKEIELNEIKLAVGAIVGAGKGAAIAVFGTNASDKTRRQIGSGIVTSAGDFSSTAEVSMFDAKDLPSDATVKIVSPSFNNDDKQIVALDVASGSKAADGSKTLTDIETKLKDSALLKIVKTPNLLSSIGTNRSANSTAEAAPKIDWHVAVVRGTYKDFKFGNPQPDISKITPSGKGDSNDACRNTKFVGGKAVAPSDAEQGFFLIGKADKMPLYNLWFSAGDQNAGKCLTDALEKYARIENLRNLTSGGSNLNDNIKVEVVKLDSMDNVGKDLEKCNAEKNTLAVKSDSDGQIQFKPNDLYYLKITNASERDLFLYIYSLTTGGAINVIYPVEGSAASERIKAGQTICTIQKEILFKVDPPEISPPGVETLKIIATKQEFPGTLLSQPAIARKGNTPFEQLLQQASTGKRSGAVSFAVSDWATKNINIEIVP